MTWRKEFVGTLDVVDQGHNVENIGFRRAFQRLRPLHVLKDGAEAMFPPAGLGLGQGARQRPVSHPGAERGTDAHVHARTPGTDMHRHTRACAHAQTHR